MLPYFVRAGVTGTFILLLLPPAFAQAPAAATETARDVVLRSLQSFNRDLDLRRNYTYEKRSVEREFDGSGQAKKTDIKTFDVMMLFGRPYTRLIAHNDAPLSAKEEQKEQEKLNKEYAARQNGGTAKHHGHKEDDEAERQFVKDFGNAFDFSFAADDIIDGEPVWIVAAESRAAFKPENLPARLLKVLSGKIWITKRDYQWVRAEADMIDDLKIGYFLASLRKGSHIEFEQTRINNEIWLPRREYLKGSARVGFKAIRVDNENAFSNYRKFTVDTKLTAIGEVNSSPQK